MSVFDVFAPLAPGSSVDVGAAVGAVEIGARLAALAEGAVLRPYAFHALREEWVVAIAGSPRLRSASGTVTLRAGDVVCCPPGPGGAHEVTGPGTVLLLGDERAAGIVEYPELGLAGSGDGRVFPTGEAIPDPGVVRERSVELPANAVSASINVLEAELEADAKPAPAGYRCTSLRLKPQLGSQHLGATIYGLDPGQAVCPYHWEGAEEEWLIVLAGAPTLRNPHGERVLAPGAAACFPVGPDGAHKVSNHGAEPCRILMLSTRPHPDVSVCVYPDSDKLGVFPGGGNYRKADAVDYWYGEAEISPNTVR